MRNTARIHSFMYFECTRVFSPKESNQNITTENLELLLILLVFFSRSRILSKHQVFKENCQKNKTNSLQDWTFE
jgi:hypothetical protein